MKEEKIKISFLNQIVNLFSFFFLCISYYLLIFIVFKELVFIEWYSHLFIILQLIPTLYIHVSYLKKNYDEEFIIAENYIIVNNNIKYFNNEILKIEIHKYESPTGHGIALFPFQNYKYCKIILKDEKSFILTSLLKPKIDVFIKEKLKGVLFERCYDYFL